MGVDSSVTIFAFLSVAFMCICVRKCPTFGGFLASNINSMAIN
jgi:hypothetical protein